MSEFSRRNLLQSIAVAATAGALPLEAAQHVHSVATAEKTTTGTYRPKGLNEHEYKTLEKLADFIIPAENGSPSGSGAGAPEFIDLLASQNPELLAIYTGGIGWLDRTCERHHNTDFLGATQEQQIMLLDLIAYRKNESPQLGPGIRFFDWARRMVVDAYYTSPAGIKDVGYMGNSAMSKFTVPQEAIEYALKRSPV